MEKVRVRFAPSPTGYLHVGNARTALFNWLFARKHDGAYVLRIEDTDAERSEAQYETRLVEDLRWLGLDWDEGVDVGGACGPYRQSDRLELYQRYARQLLDDRRAYYCFCTPEEIEADRQRLLAEGRPPKYSGRCRSIPPQEAQRRLERGEPSAVRLRVPEGPVRFRDLVHGELEFSSDVIGDPVLLRSDGHPAYNYAVVIDDALMKISHVIRGDDHISNTPRQILTYQALGWTPPHFAHLSTILGKDHTRLSKRHGATSVSSFRDQGYLPEALVNYLALLGWSPPEEGKEILSLEQIARSFELGKVSKAAAVFDPDKLNWINRAYLKSVGRARLAELSKRYFCAAGLLTPGANGAVEDWLGDVMDAILGYLDRLDQVVEKSGLIFQFDPAAFEPASRESLASEEARQVVEAFDREFEQRDPLTVEDYRKAAQQVQRQTGQKGRNLFHPLRAALTGAEKGPELEKLIPIFEKAKVLPLPQPIPGCRERLRQALSLRTGIRK
ncbi:MAG: glutamate--tRNA ligase [Acidobacteria bacterium]|nr:glutamate--tRNA ligase [Acidobacteriota bacterium]